MIEILNHEAILYKQYIILMCIHREAYIINKDSEHILIEIRMLIDDYMRSLSESDAVILDALIEKYKKANNEGET